MSEKIIVVGGGIIGCAIARKLAASGAEVVVVDEAGLAQAASGRSFGWINASFHLDAHHFRLRKEGIAAWHRLEKERGSLPISWGGALCWEEQGAALARMEAELEGLGYDVSSLERKALSERLPRLSALPDEALFFPGEGVAHAGKVTRALAQDAAEMGARFVTGVKVLEIREKGGRVTGVRTEHGDMPADQVVLAAGIGSAGLAGALGINLPMLSRPGLLLTTLPIAHVLDTVLVTPEGEIRQLADGRIMMPTSAGHQSDPTEAINQLPTEIAEAALDRIRPYFAGQTLTLEEVTLSWRPVPGDGFPVVGPAGPEGLYVATLHSGVTLAAIVAELVAQEIGTGDMPELLSPYRPGRFQ